MKKVIEYLMQAGIEAPAVEIRRAYKRESRVFGIGPHSPYQIAKYLILNRIGKYTTPPR